MMQERPRGELMNQCELIKTATTHIIVIVKCKTRGGCFSNATLIEVDTCIHCFLCSSITLWWIYPKSHGHQQFNQQLWYVFVMV